VFDDLAQLILAAIKLEASDIHFCAQRTHYRVRCRSHGELIEVGALDIEEGRACLQRIKAQAGMNIAETRQPQDGRLSLPNAQSKPQGTDQINDVRVATHPTLHGENLVMRLLRHIDGLTLESLGFGEYTLQRLRTVLNHTHGIILVAGPTGAGKTTTLHALLRALGGNIGKVMTLEDPVEIEWEHAAQTDLSRLVKMDFPSGLRSILRQDPDVILIGEIRDQETAKLALQAAMTGHLVFASVHAYDVLGAVARLSDLSIAPAELLPHLNAIIAQRLIQHSSRINGELSDTDRKRVPVAEIWNAHGLPAAKRYGLETLSQIAHCLDPEQFWSMDNSVSDVNRSSHIKSDVTNDRSHQALRCV
jgi:type II secretory ATPase GspE/PulE/Tfp pilus assembly ATPase PilB-like protein